MRGMVFCSKCGVQNPDDAGFCSKCGSKISSVTMSPDQEALKRDAAAEKEVEYYRGDGVLVVKRTEHRGAGRKAVSFLAGGPIGYVAFGRDKTRKSKAEGMLIVTNKAIYCAGNDYPFDRILSITKGGTISKSIILTFEHGVAAGGRAEGGLAGTGGLSVEIELKCKDMDNLFKGLENAKMHGKL